MSVPTNPGEGDNRAGLAIDRLGSTSHRGLMPKLAAATATRGALSITGYGGTAAIGVDPATASVAGALTPVQLTQLANLYGPPSCRAYNSAAISVASATLVVLPLNSERYDTAGMHSTVSNTSRLTVPAGWGGTYRLTGHVQFNAAAGGGRRAAQLLVNGSTVIAAQETAPTASVFPGLNPTADYPLAAGDYVELLVYQDSGGALNVNAAANYSPELAAEWQHL